MTEYENMRTADIIAEALLDWKVDVIFGLPGDGINGFMEALRKRQDRIKFILVRHEESAAFMACAYGKYTGKLGACVATSGPGFNMGLNFVSFQNSPENLYKSMIYKPSQKIVYEEVFENPIPDLHDFFTVKSAGVFFIPPIDKHDLFPGSSIFLERKKFQ